MILAVTALLVTIHFPMWGGMFTRGNPDITEEDYYRWGPCQRGDRAASQPALPALACMRAGLPGSFLSAVGYQIACLYAGF
jgi:hypothetical protein